MSSKLRQSTVSDPAQEMGPLHVAPASDGRGATSGSRPRAAGKFLFLGEEKFYVRGVTYGTFRPVETQTDGWDPTAVERDFARIAAVGLNTVRTYALPPRWMLDLALHHDLRVLVGIPWGQHATFLDQRGGARAIRKGVQAAVQSCAGHPAVLCYAVGNEIPAPIVRWSGARRIERFIEQLYHTAKDVDPEALVTYVNYPSTEYLQLPFLDLVCVNAYLEKRDRLQAYLARLQNIAGDRPLLMSEVGLDSRRHGEQVQAAVLDWQIRSAFAVGCAGVIVFAWTDEWHRGGYDVEDWDFGLTDRRRFSKPALAAVRNAVAEVPFPAALRRPRISVVVCAFNEEATIAECLTSIAMLDYPDFEVIVVDDGSTDATRRIAETFAERHGFRVISTENRGLSNARNAGLAAADGELVAFLDGDAWPDRDWLTYLAASFLGSDYVGMGGPNITSPGDGLMADAVAHAPGGPIHVLLSDTEAEHIPGCNMAFRRSALQAVGGFDPQFRVAGDDVDMCWRLQQRGWRIGFSPAAVVWHHERSSIGAYWHQQRGYGRAEALLEAKWPEKYNAACHVKWTGRIYHRGPGQHSGRRGRIYHGIWGGAPFQSLYQPAPAVLGSLPAMPEWYAAVFGLVGLAALSASWPPLAFALPVLVLAVAASVIHAAAAAGSSTRTAASGLGRSRAKRFEVFAVAALLHLLQPLARLQGRLENGLHPWRNSAAHGFALPWPSTRSVLGRRWIAPEQRLGQLEQDLCRAGLCVLLGGEHDRWDLETRGGGLGAARLTMVVEEHGWGKQVVRLRASPRFSPVGLMLVCGFAVLATLAATDAAWAASAGLGSMAVVLCGRMIRQSGVAISAGLRAFESHEREDGAGNAGVGCREHDTSAPPELLRPTRIEIRR